MRSYLWSPVATYLIFAVLLPSLPACNSKEVSGAQEGASQGASLPKMELSQFEQVVVEGTTIIEKKLVAYPAANILSETYLGRPLESLKFSWTGTLTLDQDLNIDLGLSSWDGPSEILVDGEKLLSISGANSLATHLLTAGSHEIVVNASAATKGIFHLNASLVEHHPLYLLETGLTQLPGGIPSSLEEVGGLVKPLLSTSTPIVDIQTAGSSSPQNTIEIVVPDTSEPIILIMRSYFAVNWRISGKGSNIKAIIYSAFDSGQSISAPPGVPTFELFSTQLYYLIDSPKTEAMVKLFGRPADFNLGSLYSSHEKFSIPQL
ncbi:MAG: hypothetical protein AB7F86_08365 [Bdellovibrionales bacterium]